MPPLPPPPDMLLPNQMQLGKNSIAYFTSNECDIQVLQFYIYFFTRINLLIYDILYYNFIFTHFYIAFEPNSIFK